VVEEAIAIAEQDTQAPTLNAELTFNSLLRRPEFTMHPERALTSLITYGLNRYRAGDAGVWPAYVPRDITGGGLKAPRLMAAAFRVDGLGIALLALQHAESGGYTVSGSIRNEVEDSLHEYMRDRERVLEDLASTVGLTAGWGHHAVSEAVKAKLV
jgi:hypothetical protein